MMKFVFILIASSAVGINVADARVAANGISSSGIALGSQSIDRVAVNGVAVGGTIVNSGTTVIDTVVLPSGETIALR